MLGKIARQQTLQAVEISTALTDAVMEHWTKQRDVIAPTLKPQKEEWREFWLSASSAHKWCPRMSALMTLYRDKLVGEVIKTDTMWLFDTGHAYHDMFQQKILKSFPREQVLAAWERDVPLEDASKEAGYPVFKRQVANGDQSKSNPGVVRGWQPRPETEKGEAPWRYVESKIRMHDIRVVVKMDGILELPNLPQEVLEIKTVDMSDAQALDPRPACERRAVEYRWRRESAGFPGDRGVGADRGPVDYGRPSDQKPGGTRQGGSGL